MAEDSKAGDRQYMGKAIQAAEGRLAAAIEQKISRYVRLTAPTQVDTAQADLRENPYKALLDYKLEDSPFFYGRFQTMSAAWEKILSDPIPIRRLETGGIGSFLSISATAVQSYVSTSANGSTPAR